MRYVRLLQLLRSVHDSLHSGLNINGDNLPVTSFTFRYVKAGKAIKKNNNNKRTLELGSHLNTLHWIRIGRENVTNRWRKIWLKAQVNFNIKVWKDRAQTNTGSVFALCHGANPVSSWRLSLMEFSRRRRNRKCTETGQTNLLMYKIRVINRRKLSKWNSSEKETELALKPGRIPGIPGEIFSQEFPRGCGGGERRRGGEG